MTRQKSTAMLRPEQVTVLVDSREQRPLEMAPLRTRVQTLTTGDYSVLGLEHAIAIERKSLPDLLACVGPQRDRFEREVARLLAFPVRALVIEAAWSDLEAGGWPNRLPATAVLGSCLGWMTAGLPVLPVGDRLRAGPAVARLLYLAARRRWRENQAFVDSVCPQMNGRSEARPRPSPRSDVSPPEANSSRTLGRA